MCDEAMTPEGHIRAARDELHGQYGGLQVVGRPLTDEERRRSDMLSRAVELLDEVLQVLAEEAPKRPAAELA